MVPARNNKKRKTAGSARLAESYNYEDLSIKDFGI